MKQFLLLCTICLCGQQLFAQSFTAQLFPEIAYKVKLNDDFTYTAKAENFIPFYDEQEFSVQYKNSDLQQFIGYKFNPYWQVSGGYQYRLANLGEPHHRLIQQASFDPNPHDYYSHRLRVDETFEKDEKLLVRVRYRLSAEIPLQGLKLDANEEYVKIQNEVLNSHQSGSQALENRLGATIGHLNVNSQKFEAGFNYRVGDLFTGNASHQLLLQLGAYLE